MIRLLIADDKTSMRNALAEKISAIAGIQIVSEMPTGGTHPDVILMDLSPPGNQSVEMVAAFREQGIDTPVLCLIGRLDKQVLETALQSRVDGLAARFGPFDEILDGIGIVASGGKFVAPILIQIGAEHAAVEACPDSRALRHLSHREREIITMVAAGETAADIAHRLGISGSTVYFHRRNIAGKIGLRQTADITRFAVRAGLVTEH